MFTQNELQENVRGSLMNYVSNESAVHVKVFFFFLESTNRRSTLFLNFLYHFSLHSIYLILYQLLDNY
jgi:hypothetical protein